MIYFICIFNSTTPSIFWLPAKHNDKTELALKNTQDLYSEKEKTFREECQQKLEERLKLYDSKFSKDLTSVSKDSK